MTADDIIAFDLDNNPVRAGENRLFFERVIHGEIYKARPDVMAVCHNHSPSLIPFCNSDTRLRPMVGNAAFLGEGAPVFDIRTVDDDGDLNVCTVPQASALAQALGPHWIVLLRGHGAVAVGETVRQCVRHAVIAESNARQQIEATMLGAGPFPDGERDRLCAAHETEGPGSRLAALEARRRWRRLNRYAERGGGRRVLPARSPDSGASRPTRPGPSEGCFRRAGAALPQKDSRTRRPAAAWHRGSPAPPRTSR